MLISKRIFKRFFPSQLEKSIFHIDYNKLWQKGYKALVFDIDNTLAKRTDPKPNHKTTTLINHLVKMGFKIALLSNNSKNRVDIFNKELRLPAVYKAKKPGSKGITQALKMLQIKDKRKAVLIGDQIFTDSYCGKRFNIYTIIVKPIDEKAEEWYVRLKRFPEKWVLKSYLKIQEEVQNG